MKQLYLLKQNKQSKTKKKTIVSYLENLSNTTETLLSQPD